ncbi:MAG TPA: FAD-dependent oxidoreductase, partial [Candidatus Cloacimonadota bacterium]|nr:FAD-dependent oxidoreductase [Candidatus Cloacimonadota bacterium]
ERASALILGSNPLGGICGHTCPDYHCMKACVHRTFNEAVKIPEVQATIIHNARKLKVEPKFLKTKWNRMNIAVVGAGPAGIGAAAVLGQLGYAVTLFEKSQLAGGMVNYIPETRLPKEVLQSDLRFLKKLGKIDYQFGKEVKEPVQLLNKDFDAVIVATGLDKPIKLNIPGVEKSLDWLQFLSKPESYTKKDGKIAIIGGGAIALDCALKALENKAAQVDLLCLEVPSEMPLTAKESAHLLNENIGVLGRTNVAEIIKTTKGFKLKAQKVQLKKGTTFAPANVEAVKDSEMMLPGYDTVIFAVGSRSTSFKEAHKGVFYAGDMLHGATTVVEAVATGKNTATEVDAWLQERKRPAHSKKTKSHVVLNGRNLVPIELESEFFGRKIISPFILSAAPPSDGYEQMKKAYDAGWAGGVMKTAFDDVDIHIPGEYMFVVTENTYGNCDNVSGHPLNRVCKEIKQLIKEYPDRLTMASTGGPVTGNDKHDKKGWQSNTKKLEESGVMGIEYSLSCPQGGDGTKGDIVSQDAELTAKIIDWVMEISNPEIPKLFKLTAAVTAIYPIMKAIEDVFKKYPNKKAGVTLANTFPSMAFRKGKKENWDEGIVIGLSGEGVIPISNLTLANVARFGMHISGNGGPMDYKSAADFLALGVETVQFCTIAMKHGYHVIDDLHSGLSYLLKSKGLKSVKELIGIALPNPITGFMELTSKKKISDVVGTLCQHCGNCTRCPYLAIELDKNKVPKTDPSKCIGCSVCVQKCFSGALYMRERTPKELKQLKEN